MVGIHLDSSNGEVTRWVGRDCLEASVGLRLETVAHRKHLPIMMIVLMRFMMQMIVIKIYLMLL